MDDVGIAVAARRSFDQFDELVEASQGYDLDFRQLGPPKERFWLEQAMSTSSLYTRVLFPCHFHQVGGSPRGYRTFALLAESGPPFRWCGESVTSNTLMVMPTSGDFESVSLPGFGMFNLSLAEPLLEAVANDCFGQTLDGLIGRQRRLSPNGGESLWELRQLLLAFSHDLSTGTCQEMSSELEWRCAELALACMSGEDTVTPEKPRSKRLAILGNCLARIEACGDGQPGVLELVTACGVSRRTLETAFSDGLGVSPAAYLKARRLRGLRRDLLQASRAETSVARLVAAHGFRHPGQLAADYRRLFGELPSATLSR